MAYCDDGEKVSKGRAVEPESETHAAFDALDRLKVVECSVEAWRGGRKEKKK